METYCGLALSGQQSGRYPGLCVQWLVACVASALEP